MGDTVSSNIPFLQFQFILPWVCTEILFPILYYLEKCYSSFMSYDYSSVVMDLGISCTVLTGEWQNSTRDRSLWVICTLNFGYSWVPYRSKIYCDQMHLYANSLCMNLEVRITDYMLPPDGPLTMLYMCIVVKGYLLITCKPLWPPEPLVPLLG